jgi:diketogulonate reductase-like aldo/keto reductase
LQVLLKWNMQRGVPVIPKATSRDHLAENFVDMFNWRLTNQQKVRGRREQQRHGASQSSTVTPTLDQLLK